MVVSFLVAATAGWASPQWVEALPSFRLLDPLERVFTDAHFSEHGAVVVVTAPNLSQGDAQKEWSAVLHQLPVDELGPRLVLLEDMSQSYFRPMVLSTMKSSYRTTSRVVLLLDEEGATRKALKVPESRTIAFAFSPGGKLAAVETGEASLERAQKLLEAARRAP